MTKRELVLQALSGKQVERVPVGFWFHFVEGEEFVQGVTSANVFQKNIDGHRRFIREFAPDFLKLMSDGFFEYPNETIKAATSIYDLHDIQPLGANHPWITKQVELVQELRAEFTEEIAAFYNVFAPATYFKWLFDDGDKVLANFLLEDAELTKKVLNTIAADIAILAKRVIVEGGSDGIYLSVQNVQDLRITSDSYQQFVAPSDQLVLAAANEVSEANILHICGYEGASNDLSIYQDYEAKAVNWAVEPESLSLKDGLEFFAGKTVIGGFDNTVNGLLYQGDEQEIKDFTEKLLKDAGTQGVILGADCTVPGDIAIERLEWVRAQAQV